MLKKIKRLFFVFLFLIFISPNLVYARDKIILKVFHAGSLSVPFAKMEQEFERKYPYIDVRREISGSVKAIRKITEIHKPCDVIAVADYSLIPQMLFGKYTDYVKLFARNELVLCYTSRSLYSKKINKNNWYIILNKEKVKWGFSNPNDDPCGYRTVLSLGLASIYYKNKGILNNLLTKNTNIKIKQAKYGVHFFAPLDIKTRRKKLFIRHKSVGLLGLLESGAIDYCFEYKSVAKQHGLMYINLPPDINLGNIHYIKFYKKAKITLFNKKEVEGKPIVYGISVLKDSKHPKEAKLFEDFVTGYRGKEILLKYSQTPIYPAKVISANPLRCQKCKAIYFSPNRLRLATGSSGELGLLKVLSQEFTIKNPVSICWIKPDSGNALKLLQDRQVDLVLVHAPECEKKAVLAGWASKRTLIGSYV